MSSTATSKKKKLPKSINEMSKETLQETLQKKRECNARAQHIVEALCEQCIDEQWLLKNLEFINQSHFEDVTIERALLKICGYPLCDKKLEKIAPQQYHISTRYNKVFDITERKNFCSSTCYKASNYIKNQLLTSPLWFRDHEVVPKFTILKSNKSSLGEEVQIYEKLKLEPEDEKFSERTKVKSDSESVVKLQEKCSKLSINDEDFVKEISDAQSQVVSENNVKVKNLSSAKKKVEKAVDNDKTEEVNSLTTQEGITKETDKNAELNKNNDNHNKLEISKCSKHIVNHKVNASIKQVDKREKKNILDENVVNIKTFTKQDSAHSFTEQNSSFKEASKTRTEHKEIDVIKKVENSIFEWFSIDSIFFLFGEKRLKNLLKDKADEIKEAVNNKLSMVSYNEKIERMIRLYDLFGTDSLNENMVRPDLKPLPDYSALKEEGKNIEIKVRAFFKGELEVKKPIKEKEETEEKKEGGQSENDIYLPLVDAHAQVALRRKIVLDKLTKVLPELLLIFNRDYTLQMNDVRQLVSTFSLTSRNITFKPMEWQLIGIILLKLLSIKDKYLEKILMQESAQEKLAIILEDFILPNNYLEELIKRLIDCENIIQKLE